MAIFHTINHATLKIFTTFDRTKDFPRVEAKLITTLLLSFNKYKVKIEATDGCTRTKAHSFENNCAFKKL